MSIFKKLFLTLSAAPSPAFKGGMRKHRSGSTLSKPQHLWWGVEGLTLISIFLVVVWAASSLAETKDSPSVITFSYAQEKIRQGDIWKIYLSASDPQGSMLKIVCIVRKAGTPRFRPSTLYLKKDMQKQFSGYLAFHTASALNWSGEEFVLELSILDRAGNVKGEINFPVEFDGGGPTKPLPPELEKELNRRIGYIDVDLSTPED